MAPMDGRSVIFKVGSTFEHVARDRGDYDAWFGAGFGPEHEGRIDVVDLRAGDALPPHGEHVRVVITGSGAMVTDREPWSVALAAWLLAATRGDGVRILGVCYGHQLLADALGGRVDYNPRGRQIGTVEATGTSAAVDDPLFAALPRTLVVRTSHRQCVLALPPGAVRLASSPRDENHAFRMGDAIWGVQFHPEFDAAATREYVAERRDAIRGEGDDPDDLLARVRDSDHGLRLLRRFANLP